MGHFPLQQSAPDSWPMPDVPPLAQTSRLSSWIGTRFREGMVSGETHYKAILDAARVRKRSFEKAGRPEGRPDRGCGQVGWDQQEASPACTALWTTPPGWGLTPGPNSRMHVAPSGWADPPAWDQEGRGGKP